MRFPAMECWPITTTSRMAVRNTHTSVSETCQFAARRSQTGGVLTSLALSCVSNMVGRGRELQGEWPRSLYADHASFSA